MKIQWQAYGHALAHTAVLGAIAWAMGLTNDQFAVALAFSALINTYRNKES